MKMWKPKIKAVHCTIDGITFDSIAEGRTYRQIKHVLGKDIIYPHHQIITRPNLAKELRLLWAVDFAIIPDVNTMETCLLIEYKEQMTKRFQLQLGTLSFYRPNEFKKLWIVSESLRGTINGIKPIHPANLVEKLTQFKKDCIDVN